MIRIKKLAPGLYAIVCPVRGTYRKTDASRPKTEKLVWEAIAAPPSDWLTDQQVRKSLIELGFEIPINGLDL